MKRPPIYTEVPPWETDDNATTDVIDITIMHPECPVNDVADAVKQIKKNMEDRMKIDEYLRRNP